MKKGISYSESVKEGIREGKSNAEARKVRKYNQKSGESASVDLAPMVDIAFLLLTFFIMTTSFSKPKVFGMGLPQEGGGGRGGGGKPPMMVTLKISKSADIFITKGEDKPESPMEKVEFAKLKDQVTTLKSEAEKLALIVKFSSKVKFGSVVDILDEVYRGGITEWATLVLKPDEEKAVEGKASEKK